MEVARAKSQSSLLQEQHHHLVPQRGRPSRQFPAPSPSPRKRTSPNKEAAFLFVLILCLMATSVALITQYSSVIAVNYEIQQVNREISQLQEEKAQLQAEAEELRSLERIEAIASQELGLKYPDQKEWLFLSAADRNR